MMEAGRGGIRGRVRDQHQAVDGLTRLGPSCALVASMIGADVLAVACRAPNVRFWLLAEI